MKNKKNIMMKVVRNSITKIAEKKAYANCIGFMYEPKKTEKYSKPYKKNGRKCNLSYKKCLLQRRKKLLVRISSLKNGCCRSYQLLLSRF